jgi:hypothetical protein
VPLAAQFVEERGPAKASVTGYQPPVSVVGRTGREAETRLLLVSTPKGGRCPLAEDTSSVENQRR